MDTAQAFIMGQLNKHRELMVFDWIKAVRLIKEKQPKKASAGLSGDWEWTGGIIWKDGQPVPGEETYTYLASTWATPELDMDGVIVECYSMQSSTPDWNSSTYWPQEALDELNNQE